MRIDDYGLIGDMYATALIGAARAISEGRAGTNRARG